MSNSIIAVRIHDHRLSPTLAEVSVTVTPEQLTLTTAVRGRLTGPHCAYATTVEVAYPLRPGPPATDTLTTQVLIPEPSLWSPLTPFLYEGTVELWEDGQLCDSRPIRHGLRMAQLGPTGLRWNGERLLLKGGAAGAEPWEDFRRSGCNLLLTPVTDGTRWLWPECDRRGFLLLGQVRPEMPCFSPVGTGLEDHPSCFGWLLPAGIPDHVWRPYLAGCDTSRPPWLGLTLAGPPGSPLPPEIAFVACRPDLLPALADVALPKLLVGEATGPVGNDVMGYVSEPNQA